MRILADENFPAPSIRTLRTEGHDVLAVADVMPGATDLEILARATIENRVLVTFDRDFGELAIRLGVAAPAGVVLLRISPGNPTEPGILLRELFAHPSLVLHARLTTLTRGHYRQRSGPDEVKESTAQYIALQAIAS